MSDIGKKIFERRKELGLTLEAVGKEVGVGKSTVRKWEKGMIKNMGTDKIGALARVLKMSPVDFVPVDYAPGPKQMIDVNKTLARISAAHGSGKISLKIRDDAQLTGRTAQKVIMIREDPQLKSMLKLWKVASPKAKDATIEVLKLMNDSKE